MPSKNEPGKPAPSGIWAIIGYVFSFILPVIGVIAGMMYIGNESERDRKYAKLCFGLSAAGFIFMGLMYIAAKFLVPA